MEKIKTVFLVICASLVTWIVLLGVGLVYAMFSNPGKAEYTRTGAFFDAVYFITRKTDGGTVGLQLGVNPPAALRLLLGVTALISLGTVAVKKRKKNKPSAQLDSAKEGYVLPEMKTDSAAESADSAAGSAAESAESGDLSDFERDELIKQRLAEQKSKQNS
ncbi:MAG: hypothetical protein U0L31_04420 [Bifidobacteriaceae bacterium]|nr:hypothetical protein [Bifidobacteriaceae bacterium]